MECTRCENQLLAALSDELSEGERSEFLGHVASCSACDVRWRQYQSVFGQTAELVRVPEIVARKGFSSAVLARVRADTPPSRPVRAPGWLVFGRGMAAAAMAAVCVFAGLHFAQRGKESGYQAAPRLSTPSSSPSPNRSGGGETRAEPPASERATEGGADAARSVAPKAPVTAAESEAQPPAAKREPTRPLAVSGLAERHGAPALAPTAAAVGAPDGARGGADRAVAEPSMPAPEEGAAGPPAAEAIDETDDPTAESRALIVGASGMRTGMALTHIEAVRRVQLRTENPYLTPRPQEWASASRGLHSFHFENVGLGFALSSIGKQGEVTIVVVGEVNGTVSISMDGVTSTEALQRLVDLANLRMRRIGDTRYEVRATASADGGGP